VFMAQNHTAMTAVNEQMDWSSEVHYPDVMPQQNGGMTWSVQPATSSGVVANTTRTGQNSPYYHISYEQLRQDPDRQMMRSALDMTNPLTQEEMANPMSNSEVYQGSLKNLLARNIGHYVVATFQMSGQGTVSVPGILYTVGNDYIVLYQPADGRYVTGDLYGLKFVDFHDAESVPEEFRRR